jgi:hypothetical protein
VFRSLVYRLRSAWMKNPVRVAHVLQCQRTYLRSLPKAPTEDVIVFLVPGMDIVNGGVMSIIALARETETIMAAQRVDIFVSPVPGEPPLLRFTRFKNDRTLVDLGLVLGRTPSGARLLCHIPETYLGRFLRHGRIMVNSRPDIQFQFNIMLQNIDLEPARNEVESLKEIGFTTCTTAHLAYTGEKTARRLGVPVRHFSVWISPEQYERRHFAEKENIIVVSPDHHPRRSAILNALRERLPDYEFKVVKGLTYEEYKALISRAKYALTFGEGLDGYFAETIFSGGIGCAVYNSRFFTADFCDLPGLFENWDALLEGFPEFVLCHDRPGRFHEVQAAQFSLLCEQYGFDRYVKNLVGYYDEYFCRRERTEPSCT